MELNRELKAAYMKNFMSKFYALIWKNRRQAGDYEDKSRYVEDAKADLQSSDTAWDLTQSVAHTYFQAKKQAPRVNLSEPQYSFFMDLVRDFKAAYMKQLVKKVRVQVKGFRFQPSTAQKSNNAQTSGEPCCEPAFLCFCNTLEAAQAAFYTFFHTRATGHLIQVAESEYAYLNEDISWP